ncbi:hypothetical protein AMELA_G00186050 [Ameiurus melas]|uniref:WH1 domain-containing protein n=1 Tax=Ameiurus melas TaxID=219545 RepID=A0A7J6A7Q1_AMEME|nr:hypothetical protein AMELA_G00186050 [Ameiurus melas]
MSRVLSSLLSTRENGLVFNLLGSDCSASAGAVVQLYLATAARKGKKSEWQFHSCGVRAKLLWEQELYTSFTYSTPCAFFHTFPSDECWAGLNFSDEDEASRFNTAVQSCIGGTKARPVFVRTHSLDSASGWLLKNKLNTCLSLSRPASPKAPAPAESDVTGTLTLAQKKGPLPPIPDNSNAVTSIPPHHDHLNQKHSIPRPPLYPAPNLNMNLAGVKKSASFSPGGNYASTLNQQRSLHFTDDI